MIGVNNDIHHAKMMRAIKMRLFGLGQTPSAVSDLFCKEGSNPLPGVTLLWYMPQRSRSGGSSGGTGATGGNSAGNGESIGSIVSADTVPVHKFRYRRRSGVVFSTGGNSNNNNNNNNRHYSKKDGSSGSKNIAKKHAWEYFTCNDENVEIRDGRFSTVDAFVPEKDMRVEYQVQAWNGYGASECSRCIFSSLCLAVS